MFTLKVKIDKSDYSVNLPSFENKRNYNTLPNVKTLQNNKKY